jgi:vacuolar protein sorting-associated protein VTA1
MLYTAGLMDKLEQWKTENQNDQAIHDDMAAQAFVEQFALDTFERADKAMRGRKTTFQTADTFQAARTFLDLLAIWQKPLNPEIAAKSKYAKYHALRILKAIKAGEDPNLEEEQEPPPPSPPALDPNDPEVRAINSLQPTVEDADDHPTPSYQQGLSPAPANVSPFPPPQAAGGDVSPLEPDQPTGGYFAGAVPPEVPTFTADNTGPTLPTASAGSPMDMSDPPSNIVSPISPNAFYNRQAPAIPPSVPFHPPSAPLNHPAARAAPQFHTPPPIAAPIQTPQYAPAPSGPETFVNDDEAIINAVKHGKWALSALNFDDVETAVKEFRIALQHLGAR